VEVGELDDGTTAIVGSARWERPVEKGHRPALITGAAAGPGLCQPDRAETPWSVGGQRSRPKVDRVEIVARVGDERAAAGEAGVARLGRFQLLKQFREHNRQRNFGVGGRVPTRGGDDQAVTGGEHLLEQKLAAVGSRVTVAKCGRGGEQVVGVGGAAAQDIGINAEQADDPGRHRTQRLQRSQGECSFGRPTSPPHGRKAFGGGSSKLSNAEQRIGHRFFRRAALRPQVAKNLQEVAPLPVAVRLLICERVERLEDPTDPGRESEKRRAGPFGRARPRADVQRSNLVDALP
jgi:hypothetical protein